MGHSLAEIGQAQREHQAWLIVCQQLKLASASLDINQENALHAAMVLWAEELATLRSMQGYEVQVKAQGDARRLFNQHIGFLPDVLAGAYEA